MALQALPSVVTDYAAVQRAENGAAVEEALRLWRGMGENFDPSFLSIAPDLIAVMNIAQQRITDNAYQYIPDVLEATGQQRADKPRFEVNRTSFVGTSGDGLPTETMAYGAVTTAKSAVRGGASTAEALAVGGQYLSVAMGTMLSDTGRGMEKLQAGARPITGWVRALTPPSCGRCVILAGKRERSRDAFDRHPGCDCHSIPTAESIASDFTVNADAYLSSLSEAELAKALGSKANAKVWEEYGADSSLLINAYRRTGGVRVAQSPLNLGTIKQTIGTQATGYRTQLLNVKQTSEAVNIRRGQPLRVMPESILGVARNKTEAEGLLRKFGWIY